jgi:membrane fusion protein (multidrug efflux system)
MSTPETPVAATSGNPARKKALSAVTALVAVAGLAYGAYWALVLNHYESTDNAYVAGNVVQITPQIAGTVVEVGTDDTAHVKAGDVLVRFDPADARVALEQAEAQLAQTVREVRTLYANNSTLQAQIAAREADLARARVEYGRTQDDVNRRAPLVATGAVGKEEFDHASAQLEAARSALAAAQSAVAAGREQLVANQTQTAGVSVDRHPRVARAAAQVREAFLALHRTELLAPIDGYVAKRSVQLGQRVAAGTPLMSLIALDRVWIEANFKESQLQRLRIGQPVTLQADVYGKKVEYHGSIEGLGAGTGAAFALLPAQNATGNWIKVVQRVPVRIRLEPQELVDHPLRVGLSMEARVDISDTSGRMLADGSAPPSTAQTRVYARDDSAADTLVRRVIAANGGGGSGVPRARPAGAVPAPRAAVATVAGARLAAASSAGAPSR